MLLFADDAEHQLFLHLLWSTVRDFEWTCLSYCLMPNHIHLLVRLEGPTLSRGMQRLETAWARRYNDRRGTYGHVFQGRFASQPVTTDSHLRRALRYIALNPVRAGLVPRPADFKWSAHRAIVGLDSPRFVAVGEALRPFGGGGIESIATYQAFVADQAGAEAYALEFEYDGAGPPPTPESLSALARDADADTVILTGHGQLGHSFAAIARTLGWSRWTVARRFARLQSQRAPHGD